MCRAKLSRAGKIRNYIFSLKEGSLFASRDLLRFANRRLVDQTLHRMVEKGLIVRIARGLFMRETKDMWRPSAEQVAAAKALAFGKRIFTDQNNAINTQENTATFWCSGGSSSFRYGNTRIRFKSKSKKRLQNQLLSEEIESATIIEFKTRPALPDFRPNSEAYRGPVILENILAQDRSFSAESVFAEPELVFSCVRGGK